MTITIYRVQCILPSLSGLLKDAVVNDFTIQVDDAHPTLPLGAIEDFFNTPASGSAHSAAYYINDSISRAADACKVRFYDITTHLDGSHAGPPVAESTFTLGASSGASALPDEVAIALSFHAYLFSIPEFDGSIRPRARRRGRIYLGPLNTTPIAVDSTSHNVFVSGPTITNLNAQAAALANALASGTTSYWGVWSKKDAAVRAVVGGWCDNRFDSQRRRMPDATTRVEWGTVVP